MLEKLKNKVYDANMFLYINGLAPFTWGNASGIDRATGIIVIKPSGVPYESLTPESLVSVNLDGEVVEGDLNPSSDTATHIELYKAFPNIGGVVHTHSEFAVSFAQAGRAIPAYGTTHADFSYGDIPVTRRLTKREVETDYEKNTGLVIKECFEKNKIDYEAVPAVLVNSHGPFTWGSDAMKAAVNAGTLEIVAKMAIFTELISEKKPEIDNYLLDKHYFRKHGKNAYYGQNNNSKNR